MLAEAFFLIEQEFIGAIQAGFFGIQGVAEIPVDPLQNTVDIGTIVIDSAPFLGQRNAARIESGWQGQCATTL